MGTVIKEDKLVRCDVCPKYHFSGTNGNKGCLRVMERSRDLSNIEMVEVDQFQARYFVTKDGKVYSISARKFLSPATNKSGYHMVGLRKDGRLHARRVHRLVAAAYLPLDPEKPEVNHIDGNKTNNRVENLEWCDRSHNIKHALILHPRPTKPVPIESLKKFYSRNLQLTN